MKILIVTQYFFPENFRINDFAEEFKNRGHKITVLTGVPNFFEMALIIANDLIQDSLLF